MLIVELTYRKPFEEIDKLIEAHRRFLDKYYAEGVFIASGSKEPRDGGIILAVTDRESMEELIKTDPFYQHQMADYKIMVFSPKKYCEQLRPLLEKNVDNNEDVSS